MKTKKTPEQIKEKILSCLKKGPASTKKLSEKLKSNWSTINAYLEELKREGLVRETYSRGNLKMFARTDYPVFYGLPLGEKEFNDSLFILSEIAESWKKEKKSNVSKTTMQKIAVEVVGSNSLVKVPVVRFHYGKVLAVSLPDNPAFTLETYRIRPPENEKELRRIIMKEIRSGKYSNIAWKDRRNQYERRDKHPEMEIFLIKEKLLHLFIKKEKDPEKIMDLLDDLFLKIPTSENYSEIFVKYHEFLEATYLVLNSKEFCNGNEEKKENYMGEIRETFNSLWQFLTTEFFFEDIRPEISEEFREMADYVKELKTKTCSFETEEKLNNLAEYGKILKPKKIRLDEDEQRIAEILMEGANEE